MSGHPRAFGLAIGLLVILVLTGPWFHCGNLRLEIGTVAKRITFLMIFLVCSPQNRESGVVQLNLEAMIRRTKEARNALLDIEELSGAGLNPIKARMASNAGQANLINPGNHPADRPARHPNTSDL